MGTNNPQRVNANLSAEGHRYWHDIAADYGVSVSALLEVLAPRLDAVLSNRPGMVEDARRLDTTRRRRRAA